jgi:hypothetical protein
VRLRALKFIRDLLGVSKHIIDALAVAAPTKPGWQRQNAPKTVARQSRLAPAMRELHRFCKK